MPNTATPARDIGYDVVQVITASVTYLDNGTAKVIGSIPANSLILKAMSGMQVTAVFNAGTTNVVDIGSTADDDLFGTDLAAGSLAFVPLDEAIGGFFVAAETTLTATVALSGTAATTGAAKIVIAYVTL